MRSKAQTRPARTLAEVARAAGVSIATVSRVLNGGNKERWKGSAARAQKIRRAAERLGYRPDWRARALRAKNSSAIGIVYSGNYPMMDMTSYMQMFRGFGEVLVAAGYHMMFVHVPRPTQGAQPASLLQAVDAAVFYHNITEGEIQAARLVRGPCIVVNCEPRLSFPSVRPDETGGAAVLGRHLLDLGHRRIAFVDVSREGTDYDHYSRTLRHDALRQVIHEAGFSGRFLSWHFDVGQPNADIVQRYQSLPVRQRPTAIVVSYSLRALSLLNEFFRQGITVPDELSIATFDDHSLLSNAIVPMTTIAVPMEEMGRTAAGLILGLLQKSKQVATKSIVLPERLVVRQSTGPAPR